MPPKPQKKAEVFSHYFPSCIKYTKSHSNQMNLASPKMTFPSNSNLKFFKTTFKILWFVLNGLGKIQKMLKEMKPH